MVNFIIWRDAFSVENKEIDEQHLQIVDILNQLYEAKQERLLITPRHVMDMLIRYTETHFGDEEELMRAAGYPGVKEHMFSHMRMAGKIRELVQSAIRDPDVLTTDVFDFLKKWWLGHIQNVDRMYMPYIQKHKDAQ